VYWPVLLRRIFGTTALIVMIGTFINYCFAKIDLLTSMGVLFSILLLLDLYDHWLLSHLLSGDFTERSHE
jgi:hypothetical protein